MALIDPWPASRAAELDLVGGALALDFCNTSSGRGGAEHQEHLRDGADVVGWAVHAGVLGAAAPADGDLLARALGLREAIYGILRARAHGEAAAPGWLAALAAEHAACLTQARLVPGESGYRWHWDGGVAAVLGPVALSAVELLTRSPGRLKQCPGRHCGWLFLDATRNASRRWCEMAVCGNRAKQRRRRGG